MHECNKCLTFTNEIYPIRSLDRAVVLQDFETARISGQFAHEGGNAVSPPFTKERLGYTHGMTITNPFRIFCLTKVLLSNKRTLY